MNNFATWVEVPQHDGASCHFTPHQLRKSFARFVAKRDRTQLQALSEHFKHVSIAMTSKDYVGTDFDLHELVDEKGRSETASALERLLTSRSLAGRLGERISALFRGGTGTHLRKDYISFVMRETDLRIMPASTAGACFRLRRPVAGVRSARTMRSGVPVFACRARTSSLKRGTRGTGGTVESATWP